MPLLFIFEAHVNAFGRCVTVILCMRIVPNASILNTTETHIDAPEFDIIMLYIIL